MNESIRILGLESIQDILDRKKGFLGERAAIMKNMPHISKTS